MTLFANSSGAAYAIVILTSAGPTAALVPSTGFASSDPATVTRPSAVRFRRYVETVRAAEIAAIAYNARMSTITDQDLAHDPAALLDRVEAGERLLVTRGGRLVAELRPVAPVRATARPFGLAAGAFAVPDDFDAPLPDDILRGFEGR